MRYALGHDFEILEAHGSARATGIFMQQPLITGRHFRLEARLQYEDRQLRDDIDMFSQRHAKHIRLGTASLSANGEDSLFGGGRSARHFLQPWFPAPGNRSPAHPRPRAEPQRGRLRQAQPHPAAPAAPVRPLHPVRADQRPARDQNLDSSEQFSLGGLRRARLRQRLQQRRLGLAGLARIALRAHGRPAIRGLRPTRAGSSSANALDRRTQPAAAVRRRPEHHAGRPVASGHGRNGLASSAKTNRTAPSRNRASGYAPRATSDRPPRVQQHRATQNPARHPTPEGIP